MEKFSGKDGRLLFGDSITITGATHSNGEVTVTANNSLADGDRVYISGVVGMTDLNGSFKVSDVSSSSFKVSLTTSQTWSSGGVARKTMEILNWTMEKAGEEADVSDSNTDADAEYVPAGKIRRNGTFESFRYAGNNEPSFHTEITFLFYENDDIYHSGKGFILSESISVNVPGAEAVKKSYNWRGTGVWTYTDGTT